MADTKSDDSIIPGYELTQKMRDRIGQAAEAISAAMQNYDKVANREFRSLARMIGYARIKDGASLMLETVRDDIWNSDKKSWEKSITGYVAKQLLEWKKKRLEMEIKSLEEKIKLIQDEHEALG